MNAYFLTKKFHPMNTVFLEMFLLISQRNLGKFKKRPSMLINTFTAIRVLRVAKKSYCMQKQGYLQNPVIILIISDKGHLASINTLEFIQVQSHFQQKNCYFF